MKVTLSVDALSPHLSGIGRYVWELGKGLQRRDDVAVQFHARGQIIDRPEVLLRGEPPPPRFARLRRFLPKREPDYGLVHGPNYFLPDFADTGVITVHDLSVLRHPETHPPERRKAFEREFERSMERASHILTDTETVRQEVIAAFGVRPERITSVYLGVDPAFRPRSAEDLLPALARLGLDPGGYALCVSTLEPRKRIAELLTAWKHLPDALRARFPLVLAGGAGWLNDALLVQIEAGKRAGWLKPLGFVEEAQLPAVYAGAALFLYPSIYEGFGLPPLEAMASGVPVLISNRSCLPEVCGDAARQVDPDDIDGMAAAIEDSLADRQWRKTAARRGLARAARFDWDRCIDETVAVYRKAVAEA